MSDETTTETIEVDNTTDEINSVNPESGTTETGGNLPPVAGDDGDVFPREVVEELRRENGKYRQQAKQADAYAHRLHIELVRATGRLADPSDLPFDAAHLDDDGVRLAEAIDALLESKPHLATRRPSGDIGQGQRGTSSEPFSLLGLLKGRT